MANGEFTGSAQALAHLTPRPTQTLFNDNYLSLTDMDFTQQFLPEVYEKEVERYGNRTISGFLRMVGAEMPMASDQIVWSEQNRLHLSYGTGDNNSAVITTAASGLVTIAAGHAIRVGQLVIISDGTTTTKGYVSAVGSSTTLTVLPYDAANLDTNYDDADQIKLFVFGSEFVISIVF